MTGAKFVVASKDGLNFRIPKTSKGIKLVRIELTTSDTYTMCFFAITPNYDIVEIAKYTDVHFDQLQTIFTNETGLLTRL